MDMFIVRLNGKEVIAMVPSLDEAIKSAYDYLKETNNLPPNHDEAQVKQSLKDKRFYQAMPFMASVQIIEEECRDCMA